jgi:hypothetical protein
VEKVARPLSVARFWPLGAGRVQHNVHAGSRTGVLAAVRLAAVRRVSDAGGVV